MRHVIPGKGNYPAPGGVGQVHDAAVRAEATMQVQRPEQDLARLVSGGEQDPLLRYLGEELARATSADIVVGFVMPSGVAKIRRHLDDFLRRAAASGCSPATTSA